jgi:hypothetical protein
MCSNVRAVTAMPWRWLTRWRAGRPEAGSERVLLLEARLQQLTLDAAERDRGLAQIRADLDRERAERRSDETARETAATMAEALSASVVQVLALAHLRQSGELEPGGDEVLAVALRMVRALERCGVRVVGAIGERVSFDPTRHDPLSADTVLGAGRPAVVRTVGLAYRDSVVRKAGVEAMEG